MYTVVYDTVYDRLRPYTEFVTADLGWKLSQNAHVVYKNLLEIMLKSTWERKYAHASILEDPSKVGFNADDSINLAKIKAEQSGAARRSKDLGGGGVWGDVEKFLKD